MGGRDDMSRFLQIRIARVRLPMSEQQRLDGTLVNEKNKAFFQWEKWKNKAKGTNRSRLTPAVGRVRRKTLPTKQPSHTRDLHSYLSNTCVLGLGLGLRFGAR